MNKLLKNKDQGKQNLAVIVHQYGLSSPEALRYKQALDKLIAKAGRSKNVSCTSNVVKL